MGIGMDSDRWGTRGKGQVVATVQEHVGWGRELQVLCSRGEQLPLLVVYGEVWAWLARPDLRIWQEALVVAVGFDCAAGFA